MSLLIIALWASATWLTFGALASIAQVGKTREPITPGMAITVVITSGVIVSAIVAAALILA